MLQGFGYFYIGILIATVIIGVRAVVQERLRRRALSGWVTVPGRIRDARTCEIKAKGEMTEPAIGVEPLLLYDYQFEGRDYIGTRIGLLPDPMLGTSEAARKRLRRYPPNSEVTVYVDPKEPTHAVLEARLRTSLAEPLKALAFLLLIGALWWFGRMMKNG